MNLFKELQSKKNYRVILKNLEDKANKEQHRFRSAPCNDYLDLRWILLNQEYVIKLIIKSIKNKTYFPGYAKKNIIITKEKNREIYSQAWPDKLVELLIAKLINQTSQAIYSKNLYSFQKGKSNLMALGNLSKFLQNSYQNDQSVYIFKTDITDYGSNIQLEILNQQLKTILGNQDEYFWKLLLSFLNIEYQQEDQLYQVSGLAAGFALTPVCENIYLNELDHLFEQQIPFYIRFGDDFLLASNNSDNLTEVSKSLLEYLQSYGLSVKPEKTNLITFQQASGFHSVNKFDYLGFSINQLGQLYLSQRKEKELKAYLRSKITIANATLNNLKIDKEKKVDSLLKMINFHLQNDIAHPYLDLIYHNCNNQRELKKLDTWIATQILSKVYGKGGSRVFKHYPFAKLRESGLKSVRHIANQKI